MRMPAISKATRASIQFMLNRKLTITTILLLLSIQLNAAVSNNGQTIIRIATGWGAEGVYVTTDTSGTAGECTGFNYMIDPNHPLKREMIAILLSAYQSGHKVDLYADGCYSPSTMKLMAVALHR